MFLPRLLVGFLASLTNPLSLTIVSLVWRHILNTTVAMFRVVPVYKPIGPVPDREETSKTPRWLAIIVFHYTK